MNETILIPEPLPAISEWLVKDMAPDEKPREKAVLHGIQSLSDIELLAIIFGSGMKGKSVLSLSREILHDVEFKLERLANMSIEGFTARYNGVGPAKAISLAASIELGRRCQREIEAADAKRDRFSDSASAYNFMKYQLQALQVEEFWVVYLNRSNKIVKKEQIGKGGVAMTAVDVRVIMKSAIECLASGMVLYHNHPSGNLTPSLSDDKLTDKIKSAAALFDIKVLDHLIISANGYYSYNEHGKI